jgi:hypothetical protein
VEEPLVIVLEDLHQLRSPEITEGRCCVPPG